MPGTLKCVPGFFLLFQNLLHNLADQFFTNVHTLLSFLSL